MTDPKPTVAEALDKPKLDALQALSALEFAARPDGPPTLHINKQMLRQLLEPIRDVLELAAREEAADSAVNKWLDANDGRYQSSGLRYMGGYYFTLYPSQYREDRQPFYGKTRLEALEAAAAWAKGQQP